MYPAEESKNLDGTFDIVGDGSFFKETRLNGALRDRRHPRAVLSRPFGASSVALASFIGPFDKPWAGSSSGVLGFAKDSTSSG